MKKTRTVKSTEQYDVCDVCGGKDDRERENYISEVPAGWSEDGERIQYDIHTHCLQKLLSKSISEKQGIKV